MKNVYQMTVQVLLASFRRPVACCYGRMATTQTIDRS